jgi:hypothetical protein
VAAYSGSGNFPYWVTITNTGGVTGAAAQSENIPVTASTQYQFNVIASFAATWASGAQLSLTFCNASGATISTFTSTPSSMTGGVLYQLNTGLVTAPAGSVFAFAQIILAGNATSALSVYQAEIDDQNYNQVNVNYAFSWTFWPWSAVQASTILAWNSSPLLPNDSDSLVLDGAIEVMGGAQGVQCALPELLDSNGQGPVFRILAPPSLNSAAFGYESSYDLNAPQPTQDVVSSMLLDGERPFGERASNRTISLPVIIFGTLAGGMSQVLRAREYLMSIIDQQVWQIKWTPADTGLPMIFDCFRALPSVPLYGFNYSAGGSATNATIGRPNYPIALLTLSIQALPYGRSDIDGVQQLSFNSPVINGVPTVPASTLDTFNTVFNPPPVINAPVWTAIGTANPTSVSSWNITTTHTAVVTDSIIVEVQSAANTITGVTDSAGNVYSLLSAASTGGACWQSLWIAPVSTTLNSSGTITITASGSASFSSAAYSVTGAWTKAAIALSVTGTASTENATLAGNQYNMLLSATYGLGSAGGTPTNWTSIAGNSGNGFNDTLSYYCVPLNQSTASYAVATLPNPWGAIVVALQPVNQYWNQDITTPPPTFIGHSTHYTPPVPIKAPYPAAVYSQVLPAPVNIVGCPVLSMYFGQAYDTSWPKDPKFQSNNVFSWTLTDNTGRTLNFSLSKKKVYYGVNPTAPKWTLINASIPQGRAFNYNNVVAYSVRITNWSASGHTGYIRLHCWLNDIVANPQTIQNPVSPRGSVYQLFSMPGSARSPVSVQCQLPAAAPVTKEITTPSSGTWVVPPGVYSVQAEAWGAGGAGAALNLSRAICGGGGGGGGYSQEPALPVLPGQKIPWSIGAGGLPGQLAPTVTQYTSPGLGHWTCPANVTSVLAEVWGGGAAGGAGAGGGGGGAYGRLNLPVTPGMTYSLWTGRGGKADTGTSSAQVASRQGVASWFGPPGNLQANTSYIQAGGGQTALTGSTGGGYGGNGNVVVAPQAQMATIYSNTFAASKTFTPQLNTGTKTLVAGTTGLLVMVTPAAAAIAIIDTGGNVWTQLAVSSNGSCFTYVFACPNPGKPLNAASKIVVSQSVSQAAAIGIFSVPWVVAQDSVAVTGSGSSAAPSITSSTPANAGDLVIAIFSNPSANTNSTPANWTSFGNFGSGSLFTNVFAIQNSGTGTETATSSYAVSHAWNAIALTFGTEVHLPGGRGGTSPGTGGGGGGGAAGATGAGGPGGDSQPFTASLGHWTGGGTGGTGTGQGGAGGTGANAPGFPQPGFAPGGGGGGGYQSAPLASPINPSVQLPGTQQVNYLGADGATGMVQLTYYVGSGSPVNGGNTTFGSAGTTGTVVTANGGQSAANNSATGAAGGTAGGNTISFAGGTGGLVTSGAQGSYMVSPRAASVFQALATATYNATTGTSPASSSSCAQGVAVALIESTAKVTDLSVTDSAGNIYTLQGIQAAGAGANGVTLYAYVANIEFPITTSTTITATSATSQQYGIMWQASPWLAAGVSAGNSGSGNGTSGSFTGQFGVNDTETVEIELGVVLSDGSTTVGSLTQTKTWFNAASTNSLAAGTMTMTAYTMQNQGGGTGAVSTGDVFSGSLSGSANWAVLCVPLALMNQQAAMIKIDWRVGTTPGAQTTWATEAAISANGLLLVMGVCGSGASITTGPTAMADAAGNTYTIKKTTVLPSSGGAMFVATAPVTHAMAAGTTGTYNWGTASAAPEYVINTYWLPNATSAGVDTNGVTAVTGSGTAVAGSYTPANPNDLLVAFNPAVFTGETWSSPGAPWNLMDATLQSYEQTTTWAAQATDLAATSFASTLGTTAPWGLFLFGVQMQLAGAGGGAGAGPNGPGYPGVWQFGAPGFAGAGKGGVGAGTVNAQGGGASLMGGGGGGAYSNNTTADEGGQGAQGGVRLTWAPPLQTFSNLIVHSLGSNSDPNVNPIVPIPITDVPNNTEYTVPSVSGLLPASFSSTYTILLAAYTWNNASSSSPRQVTVTVNQYEYPGGPRYSVQASRAVTPATDSVNGLMSMGEVTLPIKDYIAYNDQSYFTVSINDSDTGDRFMDVLFLDTTGQTALINIDPCQAGYGQYVNYFIDEPTPDRDLGFVGASFQDRQHQVSVLDYAQLDGGPLYIGPGDNLFLVYSTSGAPDLALSYAPRWYLDRSV